MIAGFCELDSGEIRFGSERIDRQPAHVRDIGMVFQNYAVFPNLTVAGNVAYGLKARKVASGEIDRRVEEALSLVQLTGYGTRWPHQLSGGQLQRVAIARALVIRPRVLLFDEPLSNLDARLRVSMRSEIRELQKSLGITAIYVTHDQEEAMSVSDRIALMNAGKLEQVGVPVDIYRHPVSRFAAEFMGTTNLVPASALGRPGDALVSLRPEALRLASEAPQGWPVLSGSIARLELLGPIMRLDVKLADGTVLKAAMLDAPHQHLQTGATVSLAYDPARLTVLP
jgi:ABC-type Fe3+/spermidine/putrescine transport system ATPase subunit